MRNFEERKKEIFRRSEAIIQQKKRTRKRIVYTAVPLFLTVIFLASSSESVINLNTKKDIFVSSEDRENLTDDKAEVFAPFETVTEDEKGYPYVTLHNQFNGVITEFTDTQTVNAIIELIERITFPLNSDQKNEFPLEDSLVSNEAVSSEKEVGCETEDVFSENAITVRFSDGSVKKYIYSQSFLYDLTTKKRYVLTNEDIELLNSLNEQ